MPRPRSEVRGRYSKLRAAWCYRLISARVSPARFPSHGKRYVKANLDGNVIARFDFSGSASFKSLVNYTEAFAVASSSVARQCYCPFFGAAQMKFAASFVSPEPLYCACCG